MLPQRSYTFRLTAEFKYWSGGEGHQGLIGAVADGKCMRDLKRLFNMVLDIRV